MRNLTLPRENGIAVKLYYRKYGLYLKEVQSIFFYIDFSFCRCGYVVNIVGVYYISRLPPL